MRNEIYSDERCFDAVGVIAGTVIKVGTLTQMANLSRQARNCCTLDKLSLNKDL